MTVLTDTGKVYAFGDNSKFQLGIGDTEPYNEPQLITELQSENIVKVACGKYHSAALSGKSTFIMY